MLQLELDMPGRTTREWEGPTVAPRVQAALDAALQEEDDDAELELGGNANSTGDKEDYDDDTELELGGNANATGDKEDYDDETELELGGNANATGDKEDDDDDDNAELSRVKRKCKLHR